MPGKNIHSIHQLRSTASRYRRDDDQCFDHGIIKDKKNRINDFEVALPKRFITAVEFTCNSYKRSLGSQYVETDLSRIFDAAEGLLFNILFLYFCEAKRIFPIQKIKDYRSKSLKTIVDQITVHHGSSSAPRSAASTQHSLAVKMDLATGGTEIYDTLLQCLDLIEDGINHPSISFSISGYKETMFTPNELDFIQRFKLSNDDMLRILFELAYVPCKRSNTFIRVPYDQISTRIIGGIHEHLLNFTLSTATRGSNRNDNDSDLPQRSSKHQRWTNSSHLTPGDLIFSLGTLQRKASGSFYTPDFLVQYVVEHSLSELCRELDPEDILKLKICDPAMGSGHFLVAVVHYLTETYIRKLKSRVGHTVVTEPDHVRSLILRHCIYGVDISATATKLAKMTLWLETASAKTPLYSLRDQLKSGDSLGLDKAFEWDQEFICNLPDQGFDAIVGNPPWGAMIDRHRSQIEIKYKDVSKSHKEIYKLFIHKGVEVVREDGFMGFILPSGCLYQQRSRDVREYLLTKTQLKLVVNLGDGVFGPDVSCPSCIIVTQKSKQSAVDRFSFIDAAHLVPPGQNPEIRSETQANVVRFSCVLERPDLEFSPLQLSHKRTLNFLPLAEILDLKDAGINYQRVGVGLAAKGKGSLADRLLYSGPQQSDHDIMYWKGEDLSEFYIAPKTERWLRHNFANIPGPGEVVRVASSVFSISPKLVWRQTAEFPIAAVDFNGIAFGRSIQCGILKPSWDRDWYYLLAILFNSSYLRKIYQKSVLEQGRVFPQVKLGKLQQLLVPIPTRKELKEAKSIYERITAERTLDPIAYPKNLRDIDQFVDVIINRCRRHDRES
jgi:type I restriction-modification system DNA methylase subunit